MVLLASERLVKMHLNLIVVLLRNPDRGGERGTHTQITERKSSDLS